VPSTVMDSTLVMPGPYSRSVSTSVPPPDLSTVSVSAVPSHVVVGSASPSLWGKRSTRKRATLVLALITTYVPSTCRVALELPGSKRTRRRAVPVPAGMMRSEPLGVTPE